MPAPTAYAMSKMLTQLTGRPVGFTLKPKTTPSTIKPIYGVYRVQPDETTILVRADLRLLASLGGLLVGLPDHIVSERVEESPLGELLRDAIHEVFNVASTPLSSEGRAVFKTMHSDVQQLHHSARELLSCPILATSFDVSISGYTGGEFAVYSGL
jgi:hypothetical protein